MGKEGVKEFHALFFFVISDSKLEDFRTPSGPVSSHSRHTLTLLLPVPGRPF